MSNGITILTEPRVSHCGDHALLLEADGDLALPTQERIWAVNDQVLGWDGVLDTQPGMNSLLVLLDVYSVDPVSYRERLLKAWHGATNARREGKLIEVGVVYGGEGGGDLPDVAKFHNVAAADIIKLHSQVDYTIFAPGTGPGFGYLYGLDPRLFIPRRKVPVMRKTGGGVSIAGAQAMLGAPRRPNGAEQNPTGWYTIGRATDVPVPFDVYRDPMSLVTLGDRIRFRVERVIA